VTRTQKPRSLRERERGSALLEYALVLILMLTFLFGIIDFARAVYAYHFVANAAREATRFAMVRGTTWTTPCVDDPSFLAGCQASSGNVQYYVQTQATGIGLDDANMITGTLTPMPRPNGSGTCNALDPGCTAQVTVTYPFKFIMPFLPTSTSTCNNVNASICMTSTSEMVVTQ
jgi:Flp pilus assembly protein TadG